MKRTFIGYVDSFPKQIEVKHVITDNGVHSYMNDQLYNVIVFDGNNRPEDTISVLKMMGFEEV